MDKELCLLISEQILMKEEDTLAAEILSQVRFNVHVTVFIGPMPT